MTQKRTGDPGGGVAAGLARMLEIPPELAESGGDHALAAMMAIKHGIDAASGGLCMNYLADAQKQIAQIDPARHSRLIQHLQANVVGLGGRGGNTELAHVTPGELVIPEHLQTPEVVGTLRRAAMRAGIDPDRLEVGSGCNSINPNTGALEFSDWFKDWQGGPVYDENGNPVERVTVESRRSLLDNLNFLESPSAVGRPPGWSISPPRSLGVGINVPP